MNFLSHLFAPRTTNNYRARILHASFLTVIVISFFLLSIGVRFVKTHNPEVLGISYSITDNELLQYTNLERVKNGMPELKLSNQLSDAARRKAAFMFEKNFWAHFAPDGTTPWSFVRAAGYDYSYAGENLARGFSNSSDIVSAWMNSPSHRENLLSNKYTEVGYAVTEGSLTGEDTVLVVQMFGSPSTVTNTTQKTAGEVESYTVSNIPKAETVKPPIVNAPSVSKSITSTVVIFLIMVLILDLIIVKRKKIPRIVSHNIDHIILLILFLLFILLEKTGGVL